MFRPPIPRPLIRQVKLEAGHRCAIPTCRLTTIEIAHIEPWSKVKEHKFENLIALCPNCHTRFDKGEIDRKSMLQYKANLAAINDRYSDLEKRILSIFAREPNSNTIQLPGDYDIMLMMVIDDGLLSRGMKPQSGMAIGTAQGTVYIGPHHYQLTSKGREFVSGWAAAKEILPD